MCAWVCDISYIINIVDKGKYSRCRPSTHQCETSLRHQLLSKLQSESGLLPSRSLVHVASAAQWLQCIKVESPPCLSRRERCLGHTPRRATAPGELGRTRRDVDEISEVEVLAWCEGAEDVAAAGGAHD